jgi:hypothetical protein
MDFLRRYYDMAIQLFPPYILVGACGISSFVFSVKLFFMFAKKLQDITCLKNYWVDFIFKRLK